MHTFRYRDISTHDIVDDLLFDYAMWLLSCVYIVRVEASDFVLFAPI